MMVLLPCVWPQDPWVSSNFWYNHLLFSSYVKWIHLYAISCVKWLFPSVHCEVVWSLFHTEHSLCDIVLMVLLVLFKPLDVHLLLDLFIWLSCYYILTLQIRWCQTDFVTNPRVRNQKGGYKNKIQILFSSCLSGKDQSGENKVLKDDPELYSGYMEYQKALTDLWARQDLTNIRRCNET